MMNSLFTGMLVTGIVSAVCVILIAGSISGSMAESGVQPSLLLDQNCLLTSVSGCAMSLEPNNFAEYPQQIRASARSSGQTYVRATDYYAMHYDRPDAAPADAVASLEDGSIAIMTGSVPRNHPDARISPVYRIEPGGSLAVPTGRVFLRFLEQTTAQAHQAAIESAGYTIVDSPVYAPHTAWVAAQSGNMADALNGVAQLEAIPEIENVELQMLMQRSLK